MAGKGKSKTVVAATEAEDVARKIWLAGVGAYGRMFAEAQDRVEKAAGSAGELFEQLVARGEALEDAVRDRLETVEATQKVAGVIHKIQDFRAEQRAAIKARIETVRKAVDSTIAPYNPLALARQVEELSARVAALEGKTPRRAPTAKKTVAVKAPRAAAKRVVAKRAKR
ncbi:MAG: phasin family protein [Hyphomonadaceae bacterium]|nr:phasin family protein [Hyphomonadaceae bacterium]